jgi:hypothetical protein
MRVRVLLVFGILGLTAATGSAQPQVGPTQNRPAVSPILNILRPGNSAGVNYYGLVRPQMEFRNNIQDLQQQATGNAAVIADLNSAFIPTTGHKTSFLNTGGYYSGGGSGGGTGGFGTQGGTRPQTSQVPGQGQGQGPGQAPPARP